MRKHSLRRYSVILLALAVSWPLLAQPPQEAAVPRIEKVPELDGRLDDPCWASAAHLEDFKSIKRQATRIDVHTRVEAITQQTDAYLARDDAFLYFGVRCAEENMDELRAEADEHDDYVYRDDCIEIFIDPLAGGHTYYQIGINNIGTTADSFRIDDQYSDDQWHARARVAVDKQKDAWTLEVAIPFDSLGGAPAEGDMWGFNLGRERYAGDTEWSSWADLTGGFGQPDKFARIQFGEAERAGLRVVSESRGWASPKGDVLARNVFRISLENIGQSPATAIMEAAGASKEIQLDGGTELDAELPYEIEKGAVVLGFRVRAGDNAIYEQRVPVHPDTFPRVWHVENPLFDELLGDEPPGYRKAGAMTWSHDLNKYNLWPFCVQNGRAWSADSTMAMMADVGFLPLGSSSMFRENSSNLAGLCRAHDHQAILMGYVRLKAEGAPTTERGGRQHPFAPDPVNFAVYLEDLEKALRENQDVVWGCFFCDEFQEHQAKMGIEMWEKFGEDYAYLAELDRIVREQYGFGKYGLPSSMKDQNPYKWIAYRRWLNDRAIEMAHEFRRVVKSVNPDIKTISMDPIAYMHPYNWSQLAEPFDIVTQQLYPSRHPYEPRFMAMTKLVADLTGKPFWPVPHVEHYAASFTPDEARELLSQVFRAGGKGFHFYPADVRGNRAKNSTYTERFGAPRRWATICDAVERSRTMNELDFPEADCAVLFSNDALMGEVANALTTGPRTQLTRYSTLVGLLAKAGVWFRFVDDEMVLQGADLAPYKAVFVPHATFQRSEVAALLKQYAENGGTLVIMDPEAFAHDIDGTDPKAVREALTGPGTGKTAEGPAAFSKPVEATIPGWGDRRVMSEKAAGVLARYEDGGAAVVERKIGSGSAIVFGFDALGFGASADPDWRRAFRALAKDLGLTLDQPIWRFKFPEPELPDAAPDDLCLTGNYLVYVENQAVALGNAQFDGRYRYKAPPGKIADQGGAEDWIAFSEGDLTDRRNAHTVGSGGEEFPNWCVSWEGSRADIVFDFLKPRSVSRAALWFRDDAPHIAFQGSNDLETWAPLGKCAPRAAEQYSVLRSDAEFDASKRWRYVRVVLENPGDVPEGILLAETEFWSPEE